MAIEEYDVFVIGTGTAGKSVAYDCATEGMKVAIADILTTDRNPKNRV